VKPTTTRSPVDPVHKQPLFAAQTKPCSRTREGGGFKTVNITTAELTDATPRFSTPSQACVAARARPTGSPGLGEAERAWARIADQPGSQGDVLMGGGKALVLPDDVSTADTVLQSAPSARVPGPGQSRLDRPVWRGITESAPFPRLFAAGHHGSEWIVRWQRVPRARGNPRARSECNPNREDRPHLSEMTKKAIDLLDAEEPATAGAASSGQWRASDSTSRITASNPYGRDRL